MGRRAFAVVFLLSAAQAQGGQPPSADEVFARLRDRAQRMEGLTCTLKVEWSQLRGAEPHGRIEFRAPDGLRAEHLIPPTRNPVSWTITPEVSVVTRDQRWTHMVSRDEVALGLGDVLGGIGWGSEPWGYAERVLAAQLVPDVFYQGYDIRRVFPDTLDGRPCCLILLARKDVAPNRLWIDPERGTVLKLQVGAQGGGSVPTVHTVLAHREVKPGLWLPARIHTSLGGRHEAMAVRDLDAARAPDASRFALPQGIPLLRRPADISLRLPEGRSPPEPDDPAYHYRVVLHDYFASLGQIDRPEGIAHLRRFVAQNPLIRAGYFELAQLHLCNEDAENVVATIEAGLRARPGDRALLGYQLSYQRLYRPSIEVAEGLALLVGRLAALDARLAALNAAGKAAEARRTAEELMKGWSEQDERSSSPLLYVCDTARKGGWLDELRRECQRRTEAEPPSELHLRVLISLAAEQGDNGEAAPQNKADYARLLLRLADLRRDSALVQLECAGRLAAHAPHDVEGAAELYGRLLDSPLAADPAVRAAARRGLDSLLALLNMPVFDVAAKARRERPNDLERAHVEVLMRLRRALERDLLERRPKLRDEQVLWRLRQLALWWEVDECRRAIPYLREALALAPEDFELRLRLASCLLGAGRDEEGLPLFDALVTRHPGRPEVWRAYLSTIPAKGREFRVRQLIEGLLACAPTEPDSYDLASRALADLGSLDGAARLVAQEADLVHVSARLGVQQQAARLWALAGEADKAVEAWLAALRTAIAQPPRRPQNPLSIHVRDFAQAALAPDVPADWLPKHWLPALQRAAAGLRKDDPPALRGALQFALGYAYQRTRDFPKAAASYARGLKLLPGFAEGRKWLDEIAPGYPLDDF